MAIISLSASELAVLTLVTSSRTKEAAREEHLLEVSSLECFLTKTLTSTYMTETTETPNGSILTILTKTTIPAISPKTQSHLVP